MIKQKNYRSKKLLNLAKDKPCMCCGAEDGTTVAAHANQQIYGKGKAIKSHDWAIAWLCYRCHMELDQGGMSREDSEAMWLHAHIQTMSYIFNYHVEIKQ